MKKIKTGIILCCLLLGTIGFKLFYVYTFTQNNIEYKVYVNNTSYTSFPSKGNYKVSVSCNNSKATWDYDNWKISISENKNINDKCYVEFFENQEKKYITNYIINNKKAIHGSTFDSGQIVEENGYRFEGNNPYNYILYNNEIWRIIGVFNTTLADGSTKKHLTKIIRNEAIGGYTYNKTGNNYWVNTSGTRSSLNILLNDYYYNKQDGTSSGSCYFFGTDSTRTCDYTRIGLNENYRNMVENVTWYLSGYSNTEITCDEMYQYERDGNNNYSSNANSSTGYVGLMYPSDYGYSVLASICDRTNKLSQYYSNSNCINNLWMSQSGSEWTITPETDTSSSSGYQQAIYAGYSFGSMFVKHGYAVRPVLYLKSDVYILDGDGSLHNPYIIGMD